MSVVRGQALGYDEAAEIIIAPPARVSDTIHELLCEELRRYFFMLEDRNASNRPVRVKEPHFKVFPEFVGASYMKRYEIFCRKLVLERHYTSASFITSESETGLNGVYREPANDLSFTIFLKSLVSHIGAFA